MYQWINGKDKKSAVGFGGPPSLQMPSYTTAMINTKHAKYSLNIAHLSHLSSLVLLCIFCNSFLIKLLTANGLLTTFSHTVTYSKDVRSIDFSLPLDRKIKVMKLFCPIFSYLFKVNLLNKSVKKLNSPKI